MDLRTDLLKTAVVHYDGNDIVLCDHSLNVEYIRFSDKVENCDVVIVLQVKLEDSVEYKLMSVKCQYEIESLSRYVLIETSNEALANADLKIITFDYLLMNLEPTENWQSVKVGHIDMLVKLDPYTEELICKLAEKATEGAVTINLQ